ncbi:MAG: exosortase/archaeosortase family protein [Candidatus Omnitrophota bacterium]|jgi:exosortase
MLALYLNIFVWLSAGALYLPVFIQLYSLRWQAIDYTHAYFILPVALWIVWSKLQLIWEKINAPRKNTERMRSALYFIIFAAGALLFVIGWRQDFLFISTLSLVPLSAGLIGFLYGTGVLKDVLFPIGYLLLLVPPPLGIIDQVTLPLRYWVSYAAAGVLKMTHYPVSREGTLIFIGQRQISVGDTCSGLRSLITMLALAMLYAYLNRGSLRKKIILVLCAVPLALLGNLLRILSMCLVTFYLGDNAGQRYFHDYSGIAVFILAILALAGIDLLFKERKSHAKN